MTRSTTPTATRPRRPLLVILLVIGVLAIVGVVVAVSLPRAEGTLAPTATPTSSDDAAAADLRARVEKIADRFPDGYPQHSIVLAGSSSFNRWNTSKEDLRPLETFNLGIGGTTVADQLQYIDEIVAPFDPRAVLVYVGANDISGGEGSLTGEQTADAVIDYLGRVEEVAPDARIFYVEIAETPAREAVRGEVQIANRLIAAYAETDDRVDFVPTAAALLTPEGGIDPSLFIEDGLHFDDAGYDRFSEAIRAVVLPALT